MAPYTKFDHNSYLSYGKRDIRIEYSDEKS